MIELVRKELIPAGWRSSAHLSAGFRAGDFVYTSGQVGRDPITGEVLDGVQKQTEQILKNVETILKMSGATKDDVVKVAVFLSDMKYYREMNDVYVKFFNEPRPARSCVEARLSSPDLLVEIEAVAYIPRGQM